MLGFVARRPIMVSYGVLTLCAALALAVHVLVSPIPPLEGHAPDPWSREYANAMRIEEAARPQAAATMFGAVLAVGAVGLGLAVAVNAARRRWL